MIPALSIRGRFLVFAPLVFVVLLALVPQTNGQEIHWRTNYAAVRKEANQTNRPILIDVGTVACYYCRQLDKTTFRDPRIVSLLGNKFVPLKINAAQDPYLPRALNLNRYPALVLASPEGTILRIMVGYQNARKLEDNLNWALQQVDGEKILLSTYNKAASALSVPDYPQAIQLLNKVKQTGNEHPVQAEAIRLLSALEEQASQKLRQASQLETEGKITQAEHVLQSLMRTYPGTDAARQASQRLNTRAKR